MNTSQQFQTIAPTSQEYLSGHCAQTYSSNILIHHFQHTSQSKYTFNELSQRSVCQWKIRITWAHARCCTYTTISPEKQNYRVIYPTIINIFPKQTRKYKNMCFLEHIVIFSQPWNPLLNVQSAATNFGDVMIGISLMIDNQNTTWNYDCFSDYVIQRIFIKIFSVLTNFRGNWSCYLWNIWDHMWIDIIFVIIS